MVLILATPRPCFTRLSLSLSRPPQPANLLPQLPDLAFNRFQPPLQRPQRPVRCRRGVPAVLQPSQPVHQRFAPALRICPRAVPLPLQPPKLLFLTDDLF